MCQNKNEKKIAVVTGGSQGLGLAMAEKLAGENHTTILIARHLPALNQAVEIIEKNGGTALAFQADITDENKMRKVADEIKEKFGKIDFLINNAGILHTKKLSNMSSDEIKNDLDVSLFGSVLCSKLFIPIINDYGKILFISSGFGLMGPAGYSVYAAAKAGIINFAEALNRELRNINVYVAVPGDINTPGFRAEQENMPDWMNKSAMRGKVLSPNIAAGKILSKCKGSRFLIFSDINVFMLYVLSKILPRKIRDTFIDHIFPKP